MLAVAAAVGGFEVNFAVLSAAALHECAHFLALSVFGAPIEGLRLGGLGAEIYARTERLSYGRELVAVLAGPAANLALAPLTSLLALRYSQPFLYILAGAHVLLGIYNLLPIPPLDGFRAGYLVSAYFLGPCAADLICASTGLACAVLLCLPGVYLMLHGGGVLPAAAAFGLLHGAAGQFAIAIFGSKV